MVSSEVQRTLVKSPPELWSELSDPEALGRHLGELGPIRITRLEPETLVEWESDGTKGTVRLKPSGWGTRVTLSATSQADAAEEGDPGARSDATSDLEALQAPTADPPGSAPAPGGEVAQDAAVQAGPTPGESPSASGPPDGGAAAAGGPQPEREPAPEGPPLLESPTSRPGLLTRLLGWRRRARAAHRGGLAGSEALPAGASTAALAPEAVAWAGVGDSDVGSAGRERPRPPAPEPPLAAGQPAPPAEVEQPAASERDEAPSPEAGAEAPGAADHPEPTGLSAELRAAEEATADEVTAILTSFLDRLGSAHHRPFSRA